MKKTPRMLEIERRIAESLEGFLERLYVTQEKTTYQIGEELGVGAGTVNGWLRGCEIPIRNATEARLPPGVVKPGKEKLEEMYVTQRRTPAQIGKELGVSTGTVNNWLRGCEIPIRSVSEARLPPG